MADVSREEVEAAARTMLKPYQMEREGWWMAHHRVTARRALEAAAAVRARPAVPQPPLQGD